MDRLILVISALSGINLVILSSYLWIIRRNEKPFFWLGMMSFSCAVAIINNVLISYGEGWHVFLHISLFINLSFGAYIFFFVKGLQQKTYIKKRWLYFIPSYLYIPYIIYSFAKSGYNHHLMQSIYVGKIILLHFISNLMIIGYSLTVNVILLVENFKNRRYKHQIFETLRRRRVEFLVLILLLQLISFIPYIFSAEIDSLFLLMPVSSIVYFIWVFFRMHELSRNPEIESEESLSLGNKNRYQSIRIPEHKVEEIARLIENHLNSSKPFIEPKYSLKDLSGEMNHSTHVLSMIINSRFNCSFPELINKYRIEEALKLLNKNNKPKIEAIAFSCGFGNKTSFYIAFKKHTGYLPGEYRNSK